MSEDIVNHPAHYKAGGIETIAYIKAKLTQEQFEGYLVGNVIKYISRYRHKNGAEDLKKAKVYLDWLIAHTRVSERFFEDISTAEYMTNVTDGQLVALSAIRTCYSPNKPTEIVKKEGHKYFGQEAKDGEGGTDAERLFRHIVRSGHTSTLEHITFTFAIEGISRACLAQLTRHRVGFSYSVQSQRYVKFGSKDKSGGFDYNIPPSVMKNHVTEALFRKAMKNAQKSYDWLRKRNVPSEDARMVLPQAALCNLVMTANLRALLDFYGKRRKGRGAQWEIADLAEKLREEVAAVEPWIERFFEEA